MGVGGLRCDRGGIISAGVEMVCGYEEREGVKYLRGDEDETEGKFVRFDLWEWR